MALVTHLPLLQDLAGTGITAGSIKRATGRTYIEPGTGLLKTVAADTPAFEANGLSIYGAGYTNEALHNRDLTDVVWAKTNCTAAKDQAGLDGISNSASGLVATAGNATCLQTLTLGAADYHYSVSIKRLIGTGTIEVTDNGGANWTDITSSLSTSDFYRAGITRNQANPQIGIRIVTSGDKIIVDFNQTTASVYPLPEVPTTAAPVAVSDELANSGADTGVRWTLPQTLKDILSDAEGPATSVGTLVCEWTPGYDYTHVSTAGGIAVVGDGSNRMLYHDHVPIIKLYDNTNVSTYTLNFAAETPYLIACRWDSEANGGAGSLQVSISADNGINWLDETAVNYDGAFNLGSLLWLGYDNDYPFHIRNIRFYDTVLTDGELSPIIKGRDQFGFHFTLD